MGAARGIELKTPGQIARMRAAGRVVAATLEAVSEAAAPGVTTGELDALAAEMIVVVAVVMTLYALLLRRTSRWLQ